MAKPVKRRVEGLVITAHKNSVAITNHKGAELRVPHDKLDELVRKLKIVSDIHNRLGKDDRVEISSC